MIPGRAAVMGSDVGVPAGPGAGQRAVDHRSGLGESLEKEPAWPVPRPHMDHPQLAVDLVADPDGRRQRRV